ncbi:membrane protein [Mycobacterium tuberculosis UG-D]|nr:membrane protein [Mycobacterium tuberculosis UT0093]KCH60288.1 membrane protein [Mycobacterium tuberculosis UG-D]
MVAFLGLVGAGVVGTLFLNRDRESIDDKYLAALRRSGLTGEFNSDANAIARGKQVCRQLQDGGEQQGMPVDQVAVQYYCPQFSDGFHILETITVTGSFTLKDESPNVYAPAITVSGSGCSGSAGYADIDRGTQVTVKNGQGDILATAFLQAGQGGRFLCTYLTDPAAADQVGQRLRRRPRERGRSAARRRSSVPRGDRWDRVAIPLPSSRRRPSASWSDARLNQSCMRRTTVTLSVPTSLAQHRRGARRQIRIGVNLAVRVGRVTPISSPRFSKQNTCATPGSAVNSAVRCRHACTTSRACAGSRPANEPV